MSDKSTACTVELAMTARPEAIYTAWTERFDSWFATPGSIRMIPVVGEPYWFEVEHNGARHPRYGRFLTLVPNRVVEQTWVTGQGGTSGAETVVSIELADAAPGTHLRLTHRGFFDHQAAGNHAETWPVILAHLDDVLAHDS